MWATRAGKEISFLLLNLAAAGRESLNREVREVVKATQAESGIKTNCEVDISLQYC